VRRPWQVAANSAGAPTPIGTHAIIRTARRFSFRRIKPPLTHDTTPNPPRSQGPIGDTHNARRVTGVVVALDRADRERLRLLDLGRHIREAAEAAKREAGVAKDDDRLFQRGRLMAYYEVVSLMQQQALAFDLPLGDLALDGLDPDHDLI
jgi:hypothetical protein